MYHIYTWLNIQLRPYKLDQLVSISPYTTDRISVSDKLSHFTRDLTVQHNQLVFLVFPFMHIPSSTRRNGK